MLNNYSEYREFVEKNSRKFAKQVALAAEDCFDIELCNDKHIQQVKSFLYALEDLLATVPIEVLVSCCWEGKGLDKYIEENENESH